MEIVLGNMKTVEIVIIALCASMAAACAGTTTGQAVAVPEEKSLYEQFLNNEVSMHINIETDHGEYLSFSQTGKSDFTIEELTNFLIEEHLAMQEGTRISVDKIEYAYIDCGNDGNKELALHICTPTSAEDWNEYIIIKEIDGKLESIYSNIAWSRSRLDINEYGLIAGDGSNSAFCQVFSKEYIDADGKWHYLYENSAEGRADVCGVLDQAGINPYDCVYFSFDLNNTPDNESDDYDTYSFVTESKSFEEADLFSANYYWPVIYDDTIYEDDYPLKSYFDSRGDTIYNIKEIEKMIIDKETKEGVTETIRTGKRADWKNLINH